MKPYAYYNEFDPYAAQWLRNLIAAGHIAPGVVDERSIEDVYPEELYEFTQCHFFAGIGVWSLALRRAGWRDDARIWTGSCPCQPFSAAGAGNGFDDKRHLWPHFHWLIEQCAPPIVLGEQVASKDADAWLDLVHADLEGVGYAFGAVAFPSAGIGAPHIRDRTYWAGIGPGAFGLADTHGGAGGERGADIRRGFDGSHAQPRAGSSGGGVLVRLADRDSHGRQAAPLGRIYNTAYHLEPRGGIVGLDHPHLTGLEGQRGGHQAEGGRIGAAGSVAAPGESRGLGNADREPAGRDAGTAHAAQIGHGAQDGDNNGPGHAGCGLGAELPGPTNGYWRTADWLGCRDGKWRPVEPGTFPLVNGTSGRVGRGGPDWRTPAGEESKGHRAGRLKGYGNAINAEAARVFIEAVMGSLHG